jgi:parvulin-like peptidyl-prolyl isomerase
MVTPALPEEADAGDSPYFLTSTSSAPPTEFVPSSAATGPYFPDSVPEIRSDDPVMQGPASPRWQVTVEPFEPARILARVGSEVILAGDVLGPVNQALAPYAGKVTEEQMAQQRELLIQQQLKTVIESKLMYTAFLRQIPDKSRAVAEPQIWQQVHKKFDEDELPGAMERADVKTPQELDAKLREYGWSIAKQRRTYGERALGMEGALQSVERNPVVTHQEMLDYYEDNADKYALPAAARWEQLSIRFDRTGSREEAYERIARMGNEIVLGGAPFWAVAQRDSHDIQAEQGGVHDWTTQGSLASKVLDQAVFSLPLGQMSDIIEDSRGFHILRVLERRAASRVPFTEAQVEIRKKIQGQKRQQQFQEYTERLRREIPVWTIYDDEEDSRNTTLDSEPAPR